MAVQKLLLNKEKNGMVPAVEIMLGNYTTRQLIIEKKMDKHSKCIQGLKVWILGIKKHLGVGLVI